VQCASLCGSDIHEYTEGQIGDILIKSPLVLGHEMAAVTESVGPAAIDGYFEPLKPGTRVAVDPAIPCRYCEPCEKGLPNLCRRTRFLGLWPDDGSLCEFKTIPAHCCYPIPDSISDMEAAMLEPLGVAIHATELAGISVPDGVAIFGAGPIGLLLLQLAVMYGVHPIFVVDRIRHRLEKAGEYGADAIINAAEANPIHEIMERTGHRGVGLVFEAAWGAECVPQAAEIAANEAKLVLIGIPKQDLMEMRASTARRKGLSILMCRRMKHSLTSAISLIERQRIDLKGLVTHRFPLAETAKAFELNAGYMDNVLKVLIEM
jgi:L-iditol 2-dehydrogenase